MPSKIQFFLFHCSDKWDHIMLDDECGAWQPRSHHTWMKQLCKRSRALSLSLFWKVCYLCAFVPYQHFSIILDWKCGTCTIYSIAKWGWQHHGIQENEIENRITKTTNDICICMKTFFVYVIAWDEYGNETREKRRERERGGVEIEQNHKIQHQ